MFYTKKVPFVPLSLSFLDIPEEFLNLARVVYPWNKTSDTLKLTGVPLHVLLMAEIEELKNNFERLKTEIKTNMNNVLDERGVCGNEYHTNSILDAIKQSKDKMLNHFQVSSPGISGEGSGGKD